MPNVSSKVVSLLALLFGCLVHLAAFADQGSAAVEHSTPELTAADLRIWLDGLVPYALEQANMAGAIVLVVKDGEVLFEKGYGYADVVKRVPLDPSLSLIGVDSISKTFTWTAVMQQVEQGKLDLDRDVNDYLDFKLSPTFSKPITLRELMTHTPGFAERIKSYRKSGEPPRSLGDYLRTVPPPPQIYPPGTIQAYSNYGAELAGYIVERVTGEPFPAYIEHHILSPLGMTRSTFYHPVPKAWRGDLALNYGVATDEPYRLDDAEQLIADPAGSLWSTAEDMSLFMRAHLQQRNVLLKPETLALMHKPAYVPVPGSPGTALGFFRADTHGHPVFGHDGDGVGSHSDMELMPDDGVGFFSYTNSDGSGGLIGAARTFRASLWRHFVDRYYPARDSPQEPTLASAKAHAQQVAGDYEMSRVPADNFMRALYLAARVPIQANEDGTIETASLLNFYEGRPQRWREVQPYVWREVGGSARLVMKMEGGKVKSWLPLELSGFEILPVSALQSTALNVPAIAVASALLVVASLLLPVGMLVRRHFGRSPATEGRTARARRLGRLATVVGAVYVLSWGALIAVLALSSGLSIFTPALDPWIRLIQLLGVLTLAGSAIAVWNAWVNCTEKTGSWAKVWSIALALALLDVAWFSLNFGLISIGLNY